MAMVLKRSVLNFQNTPTTLNGRKLKKTLYQISNKFFVAVEQTNAKPYSQLATFEPANSHLFSELPKVESAKKSLPDWFSRAQSRRAQANQWRPWSKEQRDQVIKVRF